MPALFSLGREPALQAVQAQLQPCEVIYVFLDDIYAVVQPERVRAVYDLLARHLEAHARIRLNQGKTRIWNRGGHAPPNIHTVGPDTWVGNRELPLTTRHHSLGGTHWYRCLCLCTALLAKHLNQPQASP
jgi:hypothetical protein